VLLAVAFTLLHLIIVWLGLHDLAALLLFALPVCFYLAYCTQESRALVLRHGLRIYLGFAGVVLASAGIVYLI